MNARRPSTASARRLPPARRQRGGVRADGHAASVDMTRRGGFTLVELLVVVTIIGILATLTSLVLMGALRRIRNQTTILEMGQLETSLTEYRDKHGQMPPNMGDTAMYSKTMPLRQWRFDQHRLRAWPRSSITYANLRTYLLTNAGSAYNYSVYVNGKQAKLDLSTLDPAEALVFWLGGFPGPCDAAGNPLTSSKLIGFHSDETNPFRLDAYDPKNPLAFVQSRTKKYFSFDEERLVDNDRDGWYEYVPRWTAETNGLLAPYVYFDAGGYGASWSSQFAPPFGGYPAPIVGSQQSGNDAQMTFLAGSTVAGDGWGLAVPYARTFNPAGSALPGQWFEPTGIQIVAPGSDGKYSNSATMRIAVLPTGVTWSGDGFHELGYLDLSEDDNLTNFGDGTLRDQVDRAQ